MMSIKTGAILDVVYMLIQQILCINMIDIINHTESAQVLRASLRLSAASILAMLT